MLELDDKNDYYDVYKHQGKDAATNSNANTLPSNPLAGPNSLTSSNNHGSLVNSNSKQLNACHNNNNFIVEEVKEDDEPLTPENQKPTYQQYSFNP